MARTSRKSVKSNRVKRKIARKYPASAKPSLQSRAQSLSGFPDFSSMESFFEPLRQIQSTLQDMLSGNFRPFTFERFFKDFEPFKAFQNFQPAINVTEDKDAYKVVACVPEINPENVEVSIGDNCLTISSRSETRETGKSRDTDYSTWSARRFYRTVPLPEVANNARAEADFVNGILTVSVPKRSGTEKSRKIPIGRKSA